MELSKNQLELIYKGAVSRGEKAKMEILEAHIMILEDPMLYGQAAEKVGNMLVKAEYAYSMAVDEQLKVFEGIEDSYIRERANDIRDVGGRMLKNLTGVPIKDISAINEEVILLGKEITPSQIAAGDPRYIKGIVSETGGIASHTAILARNGGIPAVMGIPK